ncbi:hypothetical protein ACO0R3_002458 [Hanseniaspora guilliermondii]
MVSCTNVLSKQWRLQKPTKFIPRSQWNVIRSTEMKKIEENPNVLYNQREDVFKSRMTKLKTKPKNKFYIKSKFREELSSELTNPLFMRNPLYESVRPEDRYRSIKDWKYQVGDKVVIVNKDLPGYGNITEVTELIKNGTKTNLYGLKNGGPKDLAVSPMTYWKDETSRTSYFTEEDGYVKQEDIRLIYEDPSSNGIAIVDDVDFSEEKYYNPNTDTMQYRRFVKHHPELSLEIPYKPREAGDLSTSSSVVLKQTYNPENFFDSGLPDGLFENSKSMKTLDKALSRLVTPNIRKALTGEFDFPKTPSERVKDLYKQKLESIDNLRSEYFNDKMKQDIGKKIFEKLNADVA